MSPHFSKGSSNEIAFVFSCPGQAERNAGRPAAGRTGLNLDQLLIALGPPLGLPHLTRAEITVANAWPKVEYERYTNRTEALISEVIETENITRLGADLAHVTRLVVFCGDRAEAASVELLRRGLIRAREIAFCKHLGLQGLNGIRVDCDDARIVGADEQRQAGRRASAAEIGAENTAKRLAVVARALLSSVRMV